MRTYSPVPRTHPLKARTMAVTIYPPFAPPSRVSWWVTASETFYDQAKLEWQRMRWSKFGFYGDGDGADFR